MLFAVERPELWSRLGCQVQGHDGDISDLLPILLSWGRLKCVFLIRSLALLRLLAVRLRSGYLFFFWFQLLKNAFDADVRPPWLLLLLQFTLCNLGHSDQLVRRRCAALKDDDIVRIGTRIGG